MTSGAQPCMHAAPWGAEEAGTSRRTIAGRISAICWGDEAADVEAEQICVAELQGGEERDGVARHLLDGVGVVPVEPRTPALPNVTARRSLAASASIKAGAQLSRWPRKCWSRTSGTAPSPPVPRQAQPTPTASPAGRLEAPNFPWPWLLARPFVWLPDVRRQANATVLIPAGTR